MKAAQNDVDLTLTGYIRGKSKEKLYQEIVFEVILKNIIKQ